MLVIIKKIKISMLNFVAEF